MTAAKYAVQVDLDAPAAHGFAVDMVGTDKATLELGCAGGHITSILVNRGHRVTGFEIDAEEAAKARSRGAVVHVADLDEIDVREVVGDARFDVVLAGDVLEHLRNPWRTLGQVAELLMPGGSIVMSVPNVAHIDLRVALLAGEWRYRPKGLLDDGHLRFFTRSTLWDLAESAGMVVTEMRRVLREPFSTEVAPVATEELRELVASLLPDEDALTYVYVLRLELPDDRSRAVARRLADDLHRSAAASAEERTVRRRAQVAALEGLRADSRHLIELQATKTLRLLRPAREVYRRARRALAARGAR